MEEAFEERKFMLLFNYICIGCCCCCCCWFSQRLNFKQQKYSNLSTLLFSCLSYKTVKSAIEAIKTTIMKHIEANYTKDVAYIKAIFSTELVIDLWKISEGNINNLSTLTQQRLETVCSSPVACLIVEVLQSKVLLSISSKQHEKERRRVN